MAIRKRIGVLVPSTNTTCEGDFQLVAPRDVTVHGDRLWLTNDHATEDSLEKMNGEIEAGARYLATANVDVIAYGCTTGSFYKGADSDKEVVELIQNAGWVPAAVTSPSVVEALWSVGAKKISVATPYPAWNNEKLRAYFEDQGFQVLNVESEPWASQAGNQGINDQDPEVIAEFASRSCLPEADALLCSYTTWGSLEVVEELEQRTGKPVVTSNQATIWTSFRLAGIDHPLRGFGSLLQNPAPVATLNAWQNHRVPTGTIRRSQLADQIWVCKGTKPRAYLELVE